MLLSKMVLRGMRRVPRLSHGSILACLALLASSALPLTARAEQLIWTQYFPGGFDVSVNGGALQPSGEITIVGVMDTNATNLRPGAGEYVLDSVTFTGAGFNNVQVKTELSVWTFAKDIFSFQPTGFVNEGITSWNGDTLAGDFIGTLGDLNTLILDPQTNTYSSEVTSTYWNQGLFSDTVWTLDTAGNGGAGDTIGANVGGGGPNGFVTIQLVPEPGSLALLGLGGLLLARRRR